MTDKNDNPDDTFGSDESGDDHGSPQDPLDFLRKMLGGGGADLPFGFAMGGSPNSDDDNSGGFSGGAFPGGIFFGGPFMSGDEDAEEGDDGAGGAGAGGPGGIFSMMQQMGNFFSGLSSSLQNPQEGAVNLTAARNAAIQQLGADPTLRDGQRRAAEDSVRLADIWLDGVTDLPSGITTVESWIPRTWVEESLPTWGELLAPVLDRMNKAGLEGLPGVPAEEMEQLKESMGGIMTIIGAISAYSFGGQLGGALAELSREVTCSSEMGLPLKTAGTAALLPIAIEKLSEELELSQRDVMIFVATREAAYQRLWKHVPWLAPRLVGAVQDYANGIVVDYSKVESAANEMNLDPEMLSDPSKMAEAMQNMHTIELTPEVHYTHTAAAERLETMLALVEGWVDVVVTEAVEDRIPSAPALCEMWRRRRATASAAEESLKSKAGLELRPRRVHDAITLWTRVREACGATKRDSCWDHPDLLPQASDLDNPAACIDRLLDDSSDEFDMDWEKFEQELRESGGTADDDSSPSDS